MIGRIAMAAALAAAPFAPVLAASDATPAPAARAHRVQLPALLGADERAQYQEIFALIRGGTWADATARLDAMKPGLLHPTARAQLYTAKGSPKVELEPLMQLLATAPDLAQAPQIARLAALRGAAELPQLPEQQRLVWLGGQPLRARAATTRSDTAAMALSQQVLPLIKADDAAGAEALVIAAESQLTPEALTEWRQRVAWSYYLVGDDANARRLAASAQTGVGEWAVHADWVVGLACWRQRDYAAANAAFRRVTARTDDSELQAAGYFWAARADMARGAPQLVQAQLRTAARMPETFYGMLASQALGIAVHPDMQPDLLTSDWSRLGNENNVRVAVALIEIGETRLAIDALKYQARIGPAGEHEVLLRLAGRMNLPELQLWLAHNGPAGAAPQASARYPAPEWTPDGGWRVDKSLVFAHALQESRFRADVVSPAGAYGIMQVRPGSAGDIARARGQAFDRTKLSVPSTNIEYGQSYLEQLRDYSGTGGLLPKVIAAYNAGPAPIAQWNGRQFDRGDPLLYIESVPYWETRGYIAIVLRNYWMYQQNAGDPSPSRKALAQGLWPRFPGLPGETAVRVTAAAPQGQVASAN